MDYREASGFIFFIMFPLPLPLAVCLYFTEWIFGFTSDIGAFEVEKGESILCRWQKGSVRHAPD